MFHGRGLNNRINHLYDYLLCIVYKDNNSCFKELLEKDDSFRGNIQSFVIELFKVENNISNKLVNAIFQTR